MEELTINFIGAGKLGKTVAKLIVNKQAGIIKGVCNSTFESSKQATDFIGQGVACVSIRELPKAEVLFITVPDDNIESMCNLVASLETPPKFVIHCSGLLTSEVLKAIKKRNAYVASAHPMRSFADPSVSVNSFEGTYCAIEGEPQAELVAKKIFSQIGAKNIKVEKNKKAIYHAAGVISSNYLVAITANAITCLCDAGIEKEEATNIVLSMMKGTLNNLEKTRSPKEALTGPIKRGDIQTIKSHISSFEDDLIKNLYVILGEATLKLTNHNPVKKKQIEDTLKSKQPIYNESMFLKAKL